MIYFLLFCLYSSWQPNSVEKVTLQEITVFYLAAEMSVIFSYRDKQEKGKEVQMCLFPSLYGTKSTNIKNWCLQKLTVSCAGLILDCKQGLWVPWVNSFGHNSHCRERLSTWSDWPAKVAGEIIRVDILATSLGKECVLCSLLRTRESHWQSYSKYLP